MKKLKSKVYVSFLISLQFTTRDVRGQIPKNANVICESSLIENHKTSKPNKGISACQNSILSHFHYSTCVEETAICNGTSVCDDQKDLRICKNETRWKNTTKMSSSGYVQCKGSGQWIQSQKENDGVFDCVNRHDEVPFKKSEKGELVKKQCTPRSSTSVLVFGCLLIKHVTYLKLREKCCQKMSKCTK